MTNREHQRRWRRTPRFCACGRSMGVHLESGSEWVCEACWQVEQRNYEARRKATHRVQLEEYRLCLP